MDLVLLSGQKLTLSLLATITLKVVSFRAYAPFPALLPFLKCILDVVFRKGIQHRLRFCLDYLYCVKLATFHFYLQSGKHKSTVVGNNSHVAFGERFPCGKGSVRLCVVLMHQLVLFSPKFGAKSSHIFTLSPYNVTVLCRIY
jgi:hypothetical protein